MFQIIHLARHSASYFDLILLGFVDTEPKLKVISSNNLSEFIRILKPQGKLCFKKSTKEYCYIQEMVTNIKFTGFVNVEESIDEIVCEKPNYEIGSKIDIETNQEITSSDNQKIWKLAVENLMDDDDMIDDNALLTEEDLKKPDAQSLRVCGTTGKRKACANCSCGLAEDLEQEAAERIKSNLKNVKSSCGNVRNTFLIFN